jgi:hypothetical protein
MRAFVCTDHDSTIRKLVWLNESSAGVYVGLYDEKDDPHTSYHADGRHHTKLTRGGNEIEVFRAQHQPIASIARYQQIISTGAFYADKTMHRLPQYESGSKETAFVLIGRGIFRHVEALAMNTFIVKRDYEATFLEQIYSDYQTDSYEVVAVTAFSLEHFPSHNVSVVLYRVEPGEIQDDI